MTPSDDGEEDPTEEDMVPTGRTLRRRKEKVAKHLKRGANEKEKGKFPKEMVKEEKLQEGDFEVESLMSFAGLHLCRSTPDFKHRSTPDFEHRSTSDSPNRSTGSPEHRQMTPTESTESCNAVRILTHEEFAAKHPHPPSSDNVRIARRADTSIDRHGESNIA
ncbi:hypothetical protein F2Q69_00022472 [Brassica cretica]|uniref:Uncharacterized protein n=1 Tax=Brassica cretica TaxID=69181 RepID=A0A8S9QUT0_BRACR|nr:hypothetical protein F2Q69_00022472 [Brassica cretica]